MMESLSILCDVGNVVNLVIYMTHFFNMFGTNNFALDMVFLCAALKPDFSLWIWNIVTNI